MARIKYLILTLGLVFGFGLAFIPANVGAVDGTSDVCKTNPTSPLCVSSSNDTIPKIIQRVINGLLFVLGAVTVIVIIFSGVFYTTSLGDPKLVEKAKNTLFYGVVGLIVAIMSYAIVNFVIGLFPSSTTTTTQTDTTKTNTP